MNKFRLADDEKGIEIPFSQLRLKEDAGGGLFGKSPPPDPFSKTFIQLGVIL